ncbi:MAG TPA: ATPase [Symbiobacteriaceae bacterium]|jgi:DNA repair exonuclease SbcCD ATPase subunit
MLEERIAQLRAQIERGRSQVYRCEARLDELDRQAERLRQELALLEVAGDDPAAAATRLQGRLAEAAELVGLTDPVVGLAQLKTRLGQARVALGQRTGQKQRILQDQANCQALLERHRDDSTVYEQVALLLQQTADHARQTARQQIEGLVTATLRSVFGPEYGFVIELTERGGRPEAEFYVVSDFDGELLKTRLQDSRGGGVVDIVSLGLRMAMLETYRPKLDGALILDEPAKHVSDEFIQSTALFFQKVSAGFSRQIIMVTHDAHLAETAQVAYQVVLKDNRSVVTRTV